MEANFAFLPIIILTTSKTHLIVAVAASDGHELHADAFGPWDFEGANGGETAHIGDLLLEGGHLMILVGNGPYESLIKLFRGQNSRPKSGK